MECKTRYCKFSNIKIILLQDQKQEEMRRCLDVMSSYPTDKTVSSFLLILIFLSLDKTDLYQEEEPFMQKLKLLNKRIEEALKTMIGSQGAADNNVWEICRFKLDTLAHSHRL